MHCHESTVFIGRNPHGACHDRRAGDAVLQALGRACLRDGGPPDRGHRIQGHRRPDARGGLCAAPGHSRPRSPHTASPSRHALLPRGGLEVRPHPHDAAHHPMWSYEVTIRTFQCEGCGATQRPDDAPLGVPLVGECTDNKQHLANLRRKISHSIGFSGRRIASYGEGRSTLDLPLRYAVQSQDQT